MKVTLPDGTVVEGTAEELSQLGYLPPAPPRNWDGSPKVTCAMNALPQATACTVNPERAAEIANMMFSYTDHTPGAGRLELTDNANDRVDADATADTLKILRAYAGIAETGA